MFGTHQDKSSYFQGTKDQLDLRFNLGYSDADARKAVTEAGYGDRYAVAETLGRSVDNPVVGDLIRGAGISLFSMLSRR